MIIDASDFLSSLIKATIRGKEQEISSVNIHQLV
jgi:hypothetical protein